MIAKGRGQILKAPKISRSKADLSNNMTTRRVSYLFQDVTILPRQTASHSGNSKEVSSLHTTMADKRESMARWKDGHLLFCFISTQAKRISRCATSLRDFSSKRVRTSSGAWYGIYDEETDFRSKIEDCHAGLSPTSCSNRNQQGCRKCILPPRDSTQSHFWSTQSPDTECPLVNLRLFTPASRTQ